MTCPARISTFCNQSIFTKIVWGMLLIYASGNLSYHWSQIGHALYHIGTKSDFKHTHSLGLMEANRLTSKVETHSHKHFLFNTPQFKDAAQQLPIQKLSMLKLFKHTPDQRSKVIEDGLTQTYFFTSDILIFVIHQSPPTPPPKIS